MDTESVVKALIPFFCFIVAGSVHEFFHGITAYLLGDDTAKRGNRLTLNPIAHIDPVGTIFFPLIAALTSLPVLGWMRPVPINTLNFKKSGKGMAITAFAGPYSNLLQALFAFILFAFYSKLPSSFFLKAEPTALLSTILHNYIYINLILMIFNLLPFPPLDGGWILRYFLPLNQKNLYDRIYPYGKILIYLLLFTKGAFLFSFLTDLLFKGLFQLYLIHWLFSFLPFLVALIPLLIFFFHTRKEFSPPSLARGRKETIQKRKTRRSTALGKATPKSKHTGVTLETLSHASSKSSKQEKAILLYQKFIQHSDLTEAEQQWLNEFKKELPLPLGSLCLESDFLYSDPYCKNCDRYQHCILRAIDKKRNKNYSM